MSNYITKGSSIITNRGILPVEKLNTNTNHLTDHQYSYPLDDTRILDIDGNWKKVTSYSYIGSNPAYRILLSNGYMLNISNLNYCMTLRGWESVSNLKPGDYLQIKRNLDVSYRGQQPTDSIEFSKSTTLTIPEVMSEDLALFLGILLTLGELSNRDDSVYITHSKDLIVPFEDLCNKLFNVDVDVFEIESGSIVQTFTSSVIQQWLSTLIGFSSDKFYVPYQILYGSREEVSKFLSGLTITGHLDSTKGTCVYSGLSDNVANSVFSLLRILDLHPLIVKDEDIYRIYSKGVYFSLDRSKDSSHMIDDHLVKVTTDECTDSISVLSIGKTSIVKESKASLLSKYEINDEYVYYSVVDTTKSTLDTFIVEVDTESFLSAGVLCRS